MNDSIYWNKKLIRYRKIIHITILTVSFHNSHEINSHDYINDRAYAYQSATFYQVTKGRSLVCPPYRHQRQQARFDQPIWGNDGLIGHSDEVVSNLLCLKGLAQPHYASTSHPDHAHSCLTIRPHLLNKSLRRTSSSTSNIGSSSRVQSSFTATRVSRSQHFVGLM